MKKLLTTALILLAIPAAIGQVSYNIEADNDTANISTDILLECNRFNCPELSWGKPEDYTLVNITDSSGEIESYDETPEEVTVDTGSPDSGQEKVVTLNFRSDKEANDIYDGLYQRRLSLSGFPDESMQGTVYSENLNSGDIGYGFQSSYGNNRFNFTGSRPVNIDINFGDGEKTEYYSFYGGAPEFDTGEVYEISVGTTGLIQPYERIPVAVMPSERYNRTQTKWSSGEYSSGTIRLRQADVSSLKPTLARETVHALNDEFLDWDSTSSSYMDEGTSEFVGYLFERRQVPVDQRDESVRQIFGETVKYDENPNDRYYTELPSRGDADRLWNYYQQDSEFMKTWRPGKSQHRSFGYAYSELIVRYNLIEKNITLSEIYNYMSFDQEVSSTEEKWSMLSEELDLTPCKSDEREEFDRCLQKMNDHSRFEAYRAEPSRNGEKLVINETEVPDYEEKNMTYSPGNRTSSKAVTDRESFGNFLNDIVQYVIGSVNAFLTNI